MNFVFLSCWQLFRLYFCYGFKTRCFPAVCRHSLLQWGFQCRVQTVVLLIHKTWSLVSFLNPQPPRQCDRPRNLKPIHQIKIPPGSLALFRPSRFPPSLQIPSRNQLQPCSYSKTCSLILTSEVLQNLEALKLLTTEVGGRGEISSSSVKNIAVIWASLAKWKCGLHTLAYKLQPPAANPQGEIPARALDEKCVKCGEGTQVK